MGLFKADFFRFFAFGFAAGAALMVTMVDADSGVVPSAIAATALDR